MKLKPIKLTRETLAEELAVQLDVPKVRARVFLDTALQVIATTIHEGGSVNLRGFGQFLLRPFGGFTRGKMHIKSVKKIAFVPSKKLRWANHLPKE